MKKVRISQIFFERILLHGESLVFYFHEMMSKKITTDMECALCVIKSGKVTNCRLLLWISHNASFTIETQFRNALIHLRDWYYCV